MQFGRSSLASGQFIYRYDSEVVGFASVYFSYASTITAKVAILNDLYTSPEICGKGVGKQLIEHCREFASTQSATRLQ